MLITNSFTSKLSILVLNDSQLFRKLKNIYENKPDAVQIAARQESSDNTWNDCSEKRINIMQTAWLKED